MRHTPPARQRSSRVLAEVAAVALCALGTGVLPIAPATAAPPTATTVTTTAATSVGSTTATVNGSVTPNGNGLATVSFCYGTDATLVGASGACTAGPTTFTAAATPSTVASNASATAVSASLSSLAAGATYYFRVIVSQPAPANTSSGTRLSFTTTIAKPAAPAAPTAVAGDTRATVTWTAPADNGSPITGYTVTSTPGTRTCTATAPTLTCQVTGLTNGTAYTFTATATNAIGTSPASPPSDPVTPAGTPAAPAAPTAVAGDTRATVTWTAPDNNGATITGYAVTSTPGTRTCTATAPTLTCQVTGLTNGTAYTFTVTATNTHGTSVASAASDPVTPSGRPAAPATPTAVAGDTQATVSWTAPDNNGLALTKYTVTSSPDAKTCEITTGTPLFAFCDVTGLTNGTAYTFTVTATNNNGTSDASPASDPVTPAGTPAAPASPTAVAGDTQATVTWTAPDNNGATITGYTVTSTPGTRTCTATAPALTCQVTGLTNGTAYTFTVTATNTHGTSDPSPSSAPVTPAGAPAAPASPTAVAGDTRATVTWTAPDNNGATITGYTVTSTPGTRTCTATAPTLTCQVTGLTNGTAYTFTATATNAIGTSPASPPSDPVTPAGTPAAVDTPAARAGDTTATVTWTAPDPNGSPITDYQVELAPGPGYGSWTPFAHTPSAAVELTVTGLSNGTSYKFRVTATNTRGNGPASPSSAAVTPAKAPGAPTGVAAQPHDTFAEVSWVAPADEGGSSVTGYTVTSSPIGGSCSVDTTITPIPSLSCDVRGLSNGTSYTFTVTATNRYGTSPASDPSAPVVPSGRPGSPVIVSATPGDRSATLRWSTPSDGGSPITGYAVTARPGGRTVTFPALGSATATVALRIVAAGIAPESTGTITGLVNGTHYTFTIVATSAAGSSGASAASPVVTPFGTPGAATGVTVTAGDSSATVRWTAPVATGGVPVARYVVVASPGGATCTALPPATSCTVAGLTNGITYSFTVTVVNTGGAQSTTTPAGSPTATPSGSSTSAPTGASGVRTEVLLGLLFLGCGAVLLVGSRRRLAA